MLFVDNFIHGDLHCKNWKVKYNKDTKITQMIIYDCGICFQNINTKLSTDFWFALINYDIEKLIDILKKFLKINNDLNIPYFNNKMFDKDVSLIFKNIINDNEKMGLTLIMKILLDVFRNNNAPVVSYIEDIKKYGSVKKAKEAGATSGLLNPNKFLKDFSKEGDEEDLKRFTSNLILGNEIYDVSKRNDFVGQQKQKEYLNKKTTKAMRGVGMAIEESARETFRTVAALSDAGFNTEMLDFLEQNWPEVEKSRQGVEQLSEDLTQFGISIFAGKKILNGFGKIARLTGNKFDSTRKILDRFDKTLKKGKVVKDKSGNIKGYITNKELQSSLTKS